MKLFQLPQEEHDRTRTLYEKVFPEDSRAFVDYYYSCKTVDNQIWVIEEEGTCRSMIHLNPYPMMVRGEEYKTHYIVAVATEEAFRHRGYMRMLLLRTLEEMYRNREPFTFLMPASEAIYLPFGFRTVYEQESYRMMPVDLSSRRAKPEDVSVLADFAARVLADRFEIYTKRTTAYYERLLKEQECEGGSIRIYQGKDGHLAGIVLKERAENEEIFRDPVFLPEYLPVLRRVQSAHPSLIMVRIVNLKEFTRVLSADRELTIRIRITDHEIPQNNGVFQWHLTPEGGELIPYAGIPGLYVTVEQLTDLLFGRAGKEPIRGEEQELEKLRHIHQFQNIRISEIV